MQILSLSDLWSGTLGSIVSYIIIIVILLVTLLVSLRLLITRRKIGYFSMLLSLFLLIVQYMQLIQFQLIQTVDETAAFMALILKISAFVLVNTGIYQLYNPTKLRDGLVIGLFGLATAAVASSYWFIPGWLEGSDEQIRQMQPLGLELYLFVLLFVSFLIVNPRIGQNGKFQLMLTLYFCAHLIYMANKYLFNGNQLALVKLEEVFPMIFHIVLFLFIVERIIELMQAIYNSAIKDGLTGLFNRTFFYNRVNQHISQNIAVSIIFSDIDNFKKLNDTKGHQMGDQVLKQVAQIAKEEAEPDGVCGRYGGEEIVVMVLGTTADNAAVAEKIRARVEAETIVTVSVGLSHYRTPLKTEELIKQADEAMYKAKTTGKNKVIAYS
ncbi:GGDEF domain-containing protein [Paenibacillus agricola]|uniref:GGDEF domain-containing protein n=1 Tax=Paenibacillus agricola TaxID=2716264 RepID=A0ABX0J4A8_9BACL|nr:GGDEF domain-containing protein [Paenibacillus agricola]NHN31222.1 GGDEF domain-containing protein [Paenibacillus agricola]